MHHDVGFFQDPRSWVAIAFVIFFVLFGRTMWKALTAMLDKRAETIKSELAEALRLRVEAEKMLADATAQRDTALSQATALLEGAKREATRLAQAAADEAEHAAKRREEMALLRIAAAEKAALDDVRIAAAETAAVAAKAYISATMTDTAGSALIEKGIENLPAALAKRAA